METESYLCIERKLYRAKEHFDELASKVITYYQSDPGRVQVTPTASGGATVEFIENKPTPIRFGLMFGDFLQCLRSALDYLVWELVRTSGASGTHEHQFPITETEEAFSRALKRGVLTNVSNGAVALIRDYQPFTRVSPETHFLHILNTLTNVNKHRRVLITFLAASVGERPAEFPHIRSLVKKIAEDGSVLGEFEVWSCLRIGEPSLPPIDILTVCDALFEDTYQMIQQFRPYLVEQS